MPPRHTQTHTSRDCCRPARRLYLMYVTSSRQDTTFVREYRAMRERYHGRRLELELVRAGRVHWPGV